MWDRVLVLGLVFSLGCCFGCGVVPLPEPKVTKAEPEPEPEPEKKPPLICEWQSVMAAKGVSVLEGNPKHMSVTQLIDGGLMFKHKQETSISCRMMRPPKELDESGPGPSPSKGRDKGEPTLVLR